MVAAAIFRGDLEQLQDLMRAIERNCTCDPTVPNGACPAHRAVLEQRFLDGLLFASWLRERLLADEWR